MFIGTPFTRNAGYQWDGQGKGKEENDVQTCPHCQAVILMQQWRQTVNGKMGGGFCMRCNKPTCDKPSCNNGCIPFISRLEKELDMTVKLAQYLRDAGIEAPKRPIFTGLVKE